MGIQIANGDNNPDPWWGVLLCLVRVHGDNFVSSYSALLYERIYKPPSSIQGEKAPFTNKKDFRVTKITLVLYTYTYTCSFNCPLRTKEMNECYQSPLPLLQQDSNRPLADRPRRAGDSLRLWNKFFKCRYTQKNIKHLRISHRSETP